MYFILNIDILIDAIWVNFLADVNNVDAILTFSLQWFPTTMKACKAQEREEWKSLRVTLKACKVQERDEWKSLGERREKSFNPVYLCSWITSVTFMSYIMHVVKVFKYVICCMWLSTLV